MTSSPGPVTIQLLADNEHLIEPIGDLRWREWGHAPESEERDWWVAITAREASRDRLPVTWVAIDERGGALGAVGLGLFDLEERRDRSPWVLGMIVQPHHRGMGVGSLLLATLEAWAHAHSYLQMWVATGGRAIDFYLKCGWEMSEKVERAEGDAAIVLTKRC